MNLWLIEASSGTYDSYSWTVNSIWSSKELADAEVARLTAKQDAYYTAKVKRKNEFWYEYILSYRVLPPMKLDKESE